MLRVRGAAVVACTALLLCACRGGSDGAEETAEETTVLGVATERQGSPAATSPPAPETADSPGPDETDTEPPWVRETVEPTPKQMRTPPPSPEPTSPPRETEPPPDDPEPLLSGSGWSMNTLLPDEDGEGWTEVGGQPPLDADGTSSEHLFAQLSHEPTPGDVAGRNAHCRGWVEAPAGTSLLVRGEVVIELLVGDDVVARSVDHVDIVLGAGQRHDLPAWHRSIRLHAAERDTVTCSAWFLETG